MNKFSKYFLLLLLTGLFSSILFISSAFADDAADAKSCQTSLGQNLTRAAQDKTAASHKVITDIPPIDARIFSCLTMIQAAFDINAAISNPWNLLKQLALQAVLQILNQVCAMVLQTINELKQSALSIFNLACLPIPSFSLSGSLNLPKIPCNGVNLLSPTISSSPIPRKEGVWQLWQSN